MTTSFSRPLESTPIDPKIVEPAAQALGDTTIARIKELADGLETSTKSISPKTDGVTPEEIHHFDMAWAAAKSAAQHLKKVHAALTGQPVIHEHLEREGKKIDTPQSLIVALKREVWASIAPIMVTSNELSKIVDNPNTASEMAEKLNPIIMMMNNIKKEIFGAPQGSSRGIYRKFEDAQETLQGRGSQSRGGRG